MERERYSRQSFLGPESEKVFRQTTVAVIGLGGGGSHIVQQLAHLGFLHFILYDPDVIEESNLNRLVGATEDDVKKKNPKVEIAMKIIKGIHANAILSGNKVNWQNKPEDLRQADIIFGCVDSFLQRKELEACARRYLIPYIDIGMDVFQIENEPPRMAGQVILSMPGEPCMFCMGFLNDNNLRKEATRYGDAGSMPQVVWPNGILASTSVGIAVDLLTDWTKSLRKGVYLSYDGNTGIMQPHVRLQYLNVQKCPHYPLDDVGEPLFRRL